jgi:hypothetical protein
MSRELLQLARDAMRALMNGRDFAVGQTGYYLNIIRRIEDELNRPQPKQQFYPDWDMLKPYHERIAELEAELAKPDMPTKIFGPNLEQTLNAAGFYRREWVCKNCGEQNVN